MNWATLSSLADPAVAPLAAMLLLAALPNLVFRLAGVALSRGLNEDSEILAFIRAMATALLAGVVGKLIVHPPGALAATTMTGRVGALGVAVVAFFIGRRSFPAAMIAGQATLLASIWALPR